MEPTKPEGETESNPIDQGATVKKLIQEMANLAKNRWTGQLTINFHRGAISKKFKVTNEKDLFSKK